MNLPIGVFPKGAVIWIDFIYDEDSSKHKRRPAVIIDFNQNSTSVILLKVTSKGIRTQYDYPLADAKVAGLKIGSVVRCNHIMTLYNNFKCSSIGNLSRRDAMAVEILYMQAVQNNQLTQS